MHILLQQISSGRFLTENCSWIEDRSKAKVFQDFTDALVFGRKNLPAALGAYCAFSDPGYDSSIHWKDESAHKEGQAKAVPSKARALFVVGFRDTAK